MMKKMIVMTLAFALLVGCNSTKATVNTEYYNAYASIDADDIETQITSFELYGNISDPAYVENLSTDIAIVTISSIDGGSNFGEQTNTYCYPYTYGKLKVEEVLKGDIKVGDELNYLRAGGIIDYQSYYNSMEPAQKEKHNYLSKGINPAYVEIKANGDIDIEPGKTYLAYLSNPESGEGVFAKSDSYMIISFQGGLRQVRNFTNSSSRSAGNIEVLNNFTGEWEKLES